MYMKAATNAAISSGCFFLAILALTGTAGAPRVAAEQEPERPLPLRVLQTPSGVPFGVFGAKPAAPAPTLLIFATAVADMDRNRIYSEAGRLLAKHGWLAVAIDPPCHGADQRPDEPPQLAGWAHRVKAGQDLVGPYTRRCREVLDTLIAEGYTDAGQVATCGTSRGGFCALHFAAFEPRVRAVAAVSPVTNLLALSEFAGVTPEQVRSINVPALSDRLAGRPIWLSIGNHDPRVSTEDCIAASRALAAAGRKRLGENGVAPVELVVGPSKGHSAIENAYGLAAEFLRKQVR
jgi:dienelactone hydrolase